MHVTIRCWFAPQAQSDNCCTSMSSRNCQIMGRLLIGSCHRKRPKSWTRFRCVTLSNLTALFQTWHLGYISSLHGLKTFLCKHKTSTVYICIHLSIEWIIFHHSFKEKNNKFHFYSYYNTDNPLVLSIYYV